MVVMLVLFFIATIIVEVPKLIKKCHWKDLFVFIVLISLGAIYSIGQLYDWPLPNPTKRMEYIFAPYYQMLE